METHVEDLQLKIKGLHLQEHQQQTDYERFLAQLDVE